MLCGNRNRNFEWSGGGNGGAGRGKENKNIKLIVPQMLAELQTRAVPQATRDGLVIPTGPEP